MNFCILMLSIPKAYFLVNPISESVAAIYIFIKYLVDHYTLHWFIKRCPMLYLVFFIPFFVDWSWIIRLGAIDCGGTAPSGEENYLACHHRPFWVADYPELRVCENDNFFKIYWYMSALLKIPI